MDKLMEKKDRALSLFVAVYFILNEMNAILQKRYMISGTQFQMVRMAIYGVLFILLARTFMKLSKHEILGILCIEVSTLFIYGWSWLLGVSFSRLSSFLINSMATYIPLAVSVAYIKDKKILYNYLLKASVVLLLLLMFDYESSTTSEYSMQFSSMLVLVMLIHINEFLQRKKILLFMCILFEFVMLFMYGSRGALASIAVFSVLKFITSRTLTTTKKMIYSLLVVIVAIAIYFLFLEYGATIYKFLISNGYNGRTLRLLYRGQLVTHDAGRYEIWADTIECIMEKPFLGWGIRGTISIIGHPYPHQLFLDLLVTFGIPIGIFFSLFILYQSRKVFLIRDRICKDVLIIFFSIAIVILMFSGTCFSNDMFFMFMGLALSIKPQRTDIEKN